MSKPWLLLDVDGVLNAELPRLKAAELGYSEHVVNCRGLEFIIRTNPEIESILKPLRYAFDIVWCTSCEDDANKNISHLVGLPDNLPVIHDLVSVKAPHPFLCYKTGRVLEWIKDNDRPFAWVDDYLTRCDKRWWERQPIKAKVMRIEPYYGITFKHVSELVEWSKQV